MPCKGCSEELENCTCCQTAPEDEVRVDALVKKLVCNSAREDCDGCRHCVPHEERVDVAETEGCGNELECAFHEIKVKCTPVS